MDVWAFASVQYVKAAVDNVETYLKTKGEKLVARAPPTTTLLNRYQPEINVSPKLLQAEALFFHSLVKLFAG